MTTAVEAACAANRASSRKRPKILVGDDSTAIRTEWSLVPRRADRHHRSGPRGHLRGASSSTAAKDRIVKAREYQATPSVKRYVMLEQTRDRRDRPRPRPGRMERPFLKDDDVLEMPEIGLEIRSPEIYEGVAFEDHPVEDNDNDRPPPQPDLFTTLFRPLASPRLPRGRHRATQRLLPFPELSRARSRSSFIAQYLAIGDEARIRDQTPRHAEPSARRLSRHRAYDFSPSERA